MKLKMYFACLSMLFALLNVANAQERDTTVVFDKFVHDFGAINPKDGVQTYTFEFTNKGKEAVVIQNVRASCGCTTSGWTKEPVAPGKKGQISVTYKPSGNTRFNKSLTVRLDGGDPKEVVLRIQGTVVEETAEK